MWYAPHCLPEINKINTNAGKREAEVETKYFMSNRNLQMDEMKYMKLKKTTTQKQSRNMEGS